MVCGMEQDCALSNSFMQYWTVMCSVAWNRMVEYGTFLFCMKKCFAVRNSVVPYGAVVYSIAQCLYIEM